MKYLIVATDFDDTLLKSDLSISPYTKKTIEKYENAGGTFMVSTGRMYKSIYNSAMRIGLSKGLVISYQGALVNDMNDGSVLFHKTLNCDIAVKMTKELEKEDAILHIYYNDELLVKEITDYTKNYEKVCEIKAKVIGKTLSKYIKENNITPTKILAITKPENAKKLYSEYNSKYGSECDFCISKPYYFECVAKGISKGAAIDYICKQKGLTAKNVITFGDSNNDISMLEFADLSFAVENGSLEAKKAAKKICPSNDDDGVAKMIEKYCL